MSKAETAHDVRVLEATRALLADKRHWTRGTFARDRWGHSVEPVSARAVRWCVLGGLYKCGGRSGEVHKRLYERLAAPIRAKYVDLPGKVSYWQDFQAKHAEVLTLFDVAIARARAELEAA